MTSLEAEWLLWKAAGREDLWSILARMEVMAAALLLHSLGLCLSCWPQCAACLGFLSHIPRGKQASAKPFTGKNFSLPSLQCCCFLHIVVITSLSSTPAASVMPHPAELQTNSRFWLILGCGNDPTPLTAQCPRFPWQHLNPWCSTVKGWCVH